MMRNGSYAFKWLGALNACVGKIPETHDSIAELCKRRPDHNLAKERTVVVKK